ncbi:7526_t:CDS:2 [Cetraspora pellucida]|uniref:7526_t:CDS:1 n=1 Tax=Cetraspora pellucida TaxID=1433469 RepID=A0A9N8ZVN0_9GLOM|nr:7526_t:CDS:2 [Cetraspora pellucida]
MKCKESPEPLLPETVGQDLSKQFIAGINKFKSQMKIRIDQVNLSIDDEENTRNGLPNNTRIAEDKPQNDNVDKSIGQCNSLIIKDVNMTDCGAPNADEDHRHKQNLTHLDRPSINSTRNRNRRLRKKWTNEELQALEDGMREYGTHWARILEKHGSSSGPLKNRTQVQLKDKARNEKQRRMKAGIDVGVFVQASDLVKN